MNKGIIVKSVGGVFTVLDEKDRKFTCYSPKKFRYKDGDVIIGDNVIFDELKGCKGVISQVLPRKNKLLRPEIANVDVCFVTLASEPAPDFYLVDKILINCFQQNIEPIIVVNKSDIKSGVLDMAIDNYKSVADIVSVSAKDNAVEPIKRYLDGKVACFAGQSAVGKTSILNALLPDVSGEVGGLSQKTGRGMHTTRHAVLYKVFDGFIADTCGFSLCDLRDIRSDELRLYLDDFVTVSHNCKYPSCTHTVEPDCAVKKAVEEGALCKDRYERYLEEFKELKEFEKNQY